MVLGAAELFYFIGRRPEGSTRQVVAYLSGFLVIMAGLVVAGPWLTMAGARLMARRASRPASLIAARRLADNPRAGFRAVSGLVLALFVTSSAVGIIGTLITNRWTATDGVVASNLVQTFRPELPPASDPPPAELTTVPGVKAFAQVRAAPRDMPWFTEKLGTDRGPISLASCAEIARTPDFGVCPAGAEVVWVFPALIDEGSPSPSTVIWPVAPVTAAEFQQLPVMSLVVGTDGSPAAIEGARTLLETVYPQRYSPSASPAGSAIASGPSACCG